MRDLKKKKKLKKHSSFSVWIGGDFNDWLMYVFVLFFNNSHNSIVAANTGVQ